MRDTLKRCAFGDVALPRVKLPHTLCPQPNAEPVDERGRSRICVDLCLQPNLDIGQHLSQRDFQPDEVIAKAGVKRVGQRVDTLPYQAHEQGSVARWCAGIHRQPRDMAIAAE